MGREEEFEIYLKEVTSDLATTHKQKPDRDLVEKMFLNRYTVGEAVTSLRSSFDRPLEDDI